MSTRILSYRKVRPLRSKNGKAVLGRSGVFSDLRCWFSAAAFLCLAVSICATAAQPVLYSRCATSPDGTAAPMESQTPAPAGLTEEDDSIYYYENGAMVKSRWLDLEGSRYYFKKDGCAAVSKYKIKGKYYIFNDKGQLVRPASKKVVRVTTSDGTKRYYINPDGTARSGWTKDKKYYFNKDGEMASGILLIKKKLYCFKSNGKYNAGKTKKIQKAAKHKKPFSTLRKLIGKPKKSKYYASCYGNGKDGVLRYRNFTVYTFKPARGREIFMNVE